MPVGQRWGLGWARVRSLVSMLQVFYDPHELMASLVDARNLSYRTPENDDSKLM